MEAKVIREPTRITVDGKVRVTGEKPPRLVLASIFATEKEVVTTQKAVITEDTVKPARGRLSPGMADTACAVPNPPSTPTNCAANTGPFPVE